MVARKNEIQRVTVENEQMLQRLQAANSTYNVYEWDNQRKENVKRVKNICYYKPSLLKKTHRKGSRIRRRGPATDSVNEPNKQLFDLYQQSLRQSGAYEDDEVGNNDDVNARRVMSQATDARTM